MSWTRAKISATLDGEDVPSVASDSQCFNMDSVWPTTAEDGGIQALLAEADVGQTVVYEWPLSGGGILVASATVLNHDHPHNPTPSEVV